MKLEGATELDMTILVVYHDQESLEIICLQLKHMGHNVIAAATSLEGETVARMQAPDLIIMDLGLPGREGIEAAARLKANPQTTSIPIVGYTVWDEEAYRLEARKAGITEFLLKPTSPHVLRGMIKKIFHKRAPVSKTRPVANNNPL